MWCCVGTGMENHGKYGQFAYTHRGDNLWVNLYVPSRLNWKDSGIVVEQATEFPYAETRRLRIAEEYEIPASMLEGKQQIRVKFVAHPSRQIGEIYEVRLITSN